MSSFRLSLIFFSLFFYCFSDNLRIISWNATRGKKMSAKNEERGQHQHQQQQQQKLDAFDETKTALQWDRC
jgi:hypothetical protein